MAREPLVAQVNDLMLTLGGAPLFDGASFALHKGDRAALVGANGAGKSTLMRIVAGLTEADAGKLAFASGAAVALTPQEPDLAGFATLRHYACSPSTPRDAHAVAEYAAEAALASFGLDPDRAPDALSGGEIRRAGLARAFAAEPDLLLLDEPTNHLDIEAIEALEERLRSFRGASLIVSHDRRFLERATTATLWLRQRRVLKLDRGYAAFEEWAEQVEREEERLSQRLETQLKAEEHWLRRGVTARRSRNEGRRRKLMAMRAERRERQALAAAPKAELTAAKGADPGRLVIDAKNISVSFGDRAIIDNFSMRIMRGDRVGIVGPNGAGKTTLLETLLRRRAPQSGEIRHAATLDIAYVDQARATLDPERTVWDSLAPLGGDQIMVRGKPRHVAAYARDFLFGPEHLRQPTRALSGGERNRLAVAIALARPVNLLVLDEPTNDLDMDTLDALEEALASFEGTVLIVSHDRAFLDGVATQIVGPLGGGRWVESPGGWADFERAFPRSGAAAPARPPAAKAPAPAAPRKQTKLSYKDERRLAELEVLMPGLYAEITALERTLSDAEAFARDAGAYQKAASRLEAARREVTEAEAQWLEIEALRELLSSEE
ncbi:MAG: ABC-F family ATP-binding cassette domain-containing protein [Hyphomonadaceae bacterium]|nr:ABC-F family ATP-binding cassette domain-containing protein [Hyphomonadaceae bacterium]